GSYHPYLAVACLRTTRALTFHKLKGLEEAVGRPHADPHIGSNVCEFSEGPGCIPDTVNGARYLYEIYTKAKPDYTGRVTVPVLWDKQRQTIVNNESSDIIRMLNRAFDEFGNPDLDFYPEALRADIDAVNDVVYDTVNNGVYKAGFATKQEAYEEAFDALFATLDDLDHRLGRSRYLVGDRITE